MNGKWRKSQRGEDLQVKRNEAHDAFMTTAAAKSTRSQVRKGVSHLSIASQRLFDPDEKPAEQVLKERKRKPYWEDL